MFCCNKNKMSCYKGMVVGIIAAFTSMVCFNMYKKINRNLQKNDLEFETKESEEKDHQYNREDANDEEVKLKEKIDEFNSRRLTKENELKDN